MKFVFSILAVGLIFQAAPSVASAQSNGCVSLKDIDSPFPLGSKAQIPWERVNGHWTDYGHNRYYYRFEIIDSADDGSRTVSVSLLNEFRTEVLATGLGIFRANAFDFWARVKGEDIDLKIRLQSFLPKDSEDPDERALVATIKDMTLTGGPCRERHFLKKLSSLDDELIRMPVHKGKKSQPKH